MNRIAIALVCLSVTACSQSVRLETPFDPAAHTFAVAPGKATVSGQAFMRRNDGIVVYAAGSVVRMIPDTPYTREVMRQRSDNPWVVPNITNLEPSLEAYTRTTTGDGEGRFTFANVADGDYIVFTQVRWMAGNSPQGGEIQTYAKVQGGRDTEAIMTR